MKTGRYLAALLLAVTMFMAAAGAQDQSSGQPPSGQQDPNGAQAGGSPQDANVPQDEGLPADDNQSAPQDPNRPQLQTRDANSQPQNTQKNGQPQNSVARVSLVQGNVSMQRGDSSDWSAATMNTPLVQGDQIATAERSRAEVQLDFANVIRLAGSSQVKIADLSKSRIQVQVALGYASYSVYKGNEADLEIDTPNVAIHPTRPGRYRVQVNSDNETDVIVREGEAEITTPQGSTTVKEGQVIAIRGTENPEYKVESAPPGDDWDNWNSNRDRSIETASSWQNTNRYYTGSNDLDANGRWINVPGYGQVWQPYQQGPNWAPYQDGRWVWEPGWGWTWVSYESWGWAPYHYGRWFYWNTGWVWWPGPVYPYYRPLWAPAYVSFFGFGGGFGFGFGFGSVGWLPCGPFDPFFPWYGRGFYGRVGVVGFGGFGRGFHGPFIRPLGIAGRHPFVSNTRLALSNPRVRAGITSVSRADFARGGMGSRHFGMEEGALRNSHMMTANVPVVPTRESLHVGQGARPGVGGANTGHFVTRNGSPAGPPAFHQQAAQMEHVVQNSGRDIGGSNGRFGGNEPGRGQSGSPAFSRSNTTEPTHNGNPGGNTQGNEASRGGWRSFGGNNAGQSSSHGSPGSLQGNSGASTGRWGTSSGGGNVGKPQLQMAKPIVTPRSQTPYTYSRPSAPSTYSRPSAPQSYGNYSSRGNTPQSYGNYNSSRGSSSGSYGGRSSAPSYSGGHSSGSYGGGRSSGGGGHSSGGGGSHSSGGGSHSSGGGSHSGGHH